MADVQEEREAHAMIWNLIHSTTDCAALRCAAQLGIADIINSHGSPMTLSQLSSRLPVTCVDARRFYRLMRYLVHLRVFTQEAGDGEASYGLASAAKYLLRSSDKSIVAAATALTSKYFVDLPFYLTDVLTTNGRSASEAAFGMSTWEYMSQNPGLNRMFNDAMASEASIVISALIKDCTDIFEGLTSLVDVGGGTGAAARAIAGAFPHIKCTAFDLPHVIAGAPAYPNVALLGGDMFESVPAADAVLMKGVLHNWGDDDCLKILKKCKDATPRVNGKVIIIDLVLNPASSSIMRDMILRMDLMMLVGPGGMERTEEEWKKLFEDAGYRSYQIRLTSTAQPVIEAYPH